MEKTEIIKRNLSGLPGNLALSYLSSKGCEGYGSMADWLHYAATKNDLTEITVDILNNTTTPEEAKIPHVINPIGKLKEMITTNLKKHNLDAAFIAKATLRFEIPADKEGEEKLVFCYPEIEDKDGKVYKGKKKITEKVNAGFNPKKKQDIS
jgi:ABC-type amino acid transport substrate-binding protein